MNNGPPTIDRRSSMPYYGQLKAILLERVSSVWKPGTKIPSEAELCAEFGVSRTVVRQALSELAVEGKIYKIKGKGAFVSEHRLDAGFVQRAAGFYDDMVRKSHVVTSRTLELRIELPTTRVAAHLGIDIDRQIVRFDRVRSVDGQPVQVVRTSLPADLVPGLADEDMTDRSLYAVLREKYDIRPSAGRRWISAENAESSDVELLGVAPGAALLVMTSITETAAHRPFEFFEARYRGDHTSFEIELA